jgi:hypothetical protein
VHATTTARSAHRFVAVLAVGIALLCATTACSDDDTEPSISDRTVPPVSGTIDPGVGPTRTLPPTGTGPRSTVGNNSQASIDRFDVPANLSCDLDTTVSVTARYRTSRTAHVVFLVDGQQSPGTPPDSGEFVLPVPCDGNAHTVVLTAIDDQGRAAVSSKAILTNVAPKGD